MEKNQIIEIKICGLTKEENAALCVEAGADAIGLVFFEKSPRNLSISRAASISSALPEAVSRVGVFVDEPLSFIMERVEKCRLTSVQLHGNEPPDLIKELRQKHGLTVIKALFSGKKPDLKDHFRFHASAFLVECGKGVLPGGNALAWNWGEVREHQMKKPLVLAGGLSPENILEAVGKSDPDAVDISSGVESLPGIKDIGRVKRFIKTLRGRNGLAHIKAKSIFA